jgi:hypothetical protein
MANQQIINIGSSPNDGLGDPLRTAFQKTNENFTVLFNISGITGIANGTSNISIPIANSSINFGVGNVSNVFSVLANGAITTGNHTVSSYLNAGNVTSAGTILANGTIQSLGGVTATTVTASANLVGGNLNVTNQLRASTLLLTGNIINAELNVTGNVNAGNLNVTSNIVGQGTELSVSGFSANVGNITASGSSLLMTGFQAVNGNIVATGTSLQLSGFSANLGNINVANNALITGNVSGLYFIGNGSQLTGVTAAPANIFNIINANGTSVIARSPNDTVNFVLQNQNLIMSGASNVLTRTVFFDFSNSPTFTGTVTSTGFIGDLKGSVFADDSSVMVDAVDNKLYAASLTTTGNISANYVLGNGSALTGIVTNAIFNGTSNLRIDTGNGNISANVGGTANIFLISSTGVNIAGTLNVVGNTTLGNLSTDIITASGNVTAANISTNIISASGNATTGNLTTTIISASGNVTTGNLTTNIISASGNVTTANLNTGIISASGNIDGANLNISNQATVTGNVTAQYFIGNVLGNISGNLNVAGGNAQVVFNDSGIANATPGFTFDKTTNAVATTGTFSAFGNVTGNYFLGNGSFLTGVITSVANINNGTSNVTVLSSGGDITVGVGGTGNVAVFSTVGVEVAGNVTGGNFVSTTSGQISTNGNVTGGNVLTATLFTNIGSGGSAIQNGGANGGGNIGNATGHFNTAFVTEVLASGNITGGNIISNGQVSSTGNITAGNIITAGILSVNSGNAATAVENAAGNGIGNIGSSLSHFNIVFAKATSAQYADVAEAYLADFNYQPGTVLSIGGRAEVTMSQMDADPMVVGVVSTSPAIRMNDGLLGRNVVQIALLGRVPAYVRGPVRRGEMLVSAGNGRLRSELNPKPGTIVGKSLENFDGESGIVEILVGRN